MQKVNTKLPAFGRQEGGSMEQKNLDQIIRETVARYMNRSLIVAGNWKMNMTVREGMEFLEKLGPVDGKVMIFPSYTTLAVLAGEFRKRGIIYGPQNFHYKESGAYTGEISLPMIKELGCDCLLVGHSERRSYYNETDEEIQKKIQAALKEGFSVMLCIGENLEERKSGQWKNVLRKQLEKDLEGLSTDRIPYIQIAYEPIWAIGTGVSASTEEITETHRYLKAVLSELTGSDIPLLYGGSVNEKNAADIGSCPGVDGFLIGGASLKPEKFRKIIEVSKRE